MRGLSALLEIFVICLFVSIAYGQIDSEKTEDAPIPREQNRFPEKEPLFVKPKGPQKGGTVTVPHPRAEKGLIRIEKDGSYIFKTKIFDKSKAGSLKFGTMAPPKITAEGNSSITFDSMYGSQKISGILFDFEWQPFSRFGRLGLQLGFGLFNARGNGMFKGQTNQGGEARTQAEEIYNLYMVPMSLFGVYRFEYVRNQWIVPFINGGVTYYGLAEIRDDGKKQNINGAAAVGGGGGVHFSISALDRQKAFSIGQEYGIADLWLTVEARVLKGLSSEKDFTSTGVNVGITVDY